MKTLYLILPLWLIGCTNQGDIKNEESKRIDSKKRADSIENVKWEREFRKTQHKDSLQDIDDIKNGKIFPISEKKDEDFNQIFNFKICNKSNVTLTTIQFIFIKNGYTLNIPRDQNFFDDPNDGHNKINYHLKLLPFDTTVISVQPGFASWYYGWAMFRYTDGTTSKEKMCYPWGITQTRIKYGGM